MTCYLNYGLNILRALRRTKPHQCEDITIKNNSSNALIFKLQSVNFDSHPCRFFELLVT